MIYKHYVQCGHCSKTLGFMMGGGCIPSIYCAACEDVVTHKEEMVEEELALYRAAANRR